MIRQWMLLSVATTLRVIPPPGQGHGNLLELACKRKGGIDVLIGDVFFHLRDIASFHPSHKKTE